MNSKGLETSSCNFMDLLLAKKFHEKSYPGETYPWKKTYPQINVCSLREKNVPRRNRNKN